MGVGKQEVCVGVDGEIGWKDERLAPGSTAGGVKAVKLSSKSGAANTFTTKGIGSSRAYIRPNGR